MSNQAQCPNCGGYKLTSAKVALTKQIPITSFSQRLTLLAPGIFFLAIGILIGLAARFSGNSDSGGCGAALALVGLALFAVGMGTKNLQKKVGDGYRYECLLCGYRWEWHEGQPWPKVKVDPDLISKGVQQLEKETEEERKRQEELYHLSKLGKK